MLKLKLFGGAVLEAPDGPVRGRATHRRRLAVLALLATARTGRIGRERVVALLWPESEADAARRLLSESLYALRRVLGEDAILTVGDEVGLSPDRLWCDVTAFQEALASGDVATAAAVYAGPFLDGFYVSGAAEFERWAEGERERLAHANARVLEQLAEQHEVSGDIVGAVDWWRRLLACDPYSSRVVMRLMRALEGSGDRAAALRVAATHAELMREELGVEPEPTVARLADQLRTAPEEGPPVPAPVRAPPPPPTSPGEAPPIPPPTTTFPGAGSAGAGAVAVAASTGRRWWWRPAALVALAASLTAGVLVFGRWEDPSREGAVNVMVLPFWDGAGGGLHGDAGELQRLLASSLSAVPGIWTMDGSPLAPRAAPREVPLDRLLAQARARSARYLVVPEVISVVSVAVTAYDAADGTQVLRETGGGGGEPLEGAVQRIALEVARGIATREGLDLGEAGYLLAATESPVALSRFLHAHALFRACNFDDAANGFRRAIAADSSFLLAYQRLSVVETWNPRWDYAAALAAVDAGLARRDRAPPLYGRLLDAQRRYLLREGAAAVERFQWLTVDDPTLIDGWLGLAESLFHYRGLLGGDPADARRALERVVELDSAFAPAYEHLAEIAIREGDGEAARRWSAWVTNPTEASAYRLAVAIRFGSTQERRGAWQAADTSQRTTISNLVRIFAREPERVERLGMVLVKSGRTPMDRRWGADYRLIALASQGRWAEARAAWNSVPAAEPFDKWVVATYLAGYPAGDLALPMLDWAREQVDAVGRVDLSTPFTDTRDPFRALVHNALLRGDSAEVRRLLAWLHAAEAGADAADPEPLGLRGTLNARLALLAGDTASAVRHLQEALRRAPWWISPWAPLASAAPERMLLAKLLLARGQPDAAERWLNSFGRVDAIGDLLYVNQVRVLRARSDEPPRVHRRSSL